MQGKERRGAEAGGKDRLQKQRKSMSQQGKSSAEQEGNVEAAETMRRHPADKQTAKPYMEKPAANMKEKIELYQ